MYKVSVEILEDCLKAIQTSDKLLKASNSGAKLHPKEVKKCTDLNKKIIFILENNFGV